MKTAFDFLKENGLATTDGSGNYLVAPHASYYGLLNAMNQYAAYLSNERVKEIENKLTSAVIDGHELLKSNEAKDLTIERLESDLSEAVEIMGAIYDNVDKYHLDFAFAGGECYDKLKEYLGV